MVSIALGAFLLCCPAQAGDDLETVLSTLQKRVEGIRDVRASFVYTYFDTDGRTKEKRPKVPFQGDLSFRAPSRAAWSVHFNSREVGNQGYADWVDPQKGLRAALDPDELRLHIPWKLHVPEDFGGLIAREHHGAVYYRAGLETHVPAPLALLAQPLQFRPILFLFELSPRAILGRLPSLAFSGRTKEDGKSYVLLTTKPVDLRDAARIEESQRRRDQTWMKGEIWIDEAEGVIDRVVMEYENASASPRHRFTQDFRYGRRVGGIATLITGAAMQMELRDLRSNVGVTDAEVRIDIPAEAIVRDWVAQPKEVYEQRLEKDPGDAAAWLNLGSLRFRQQNYAAAVEAFKKVVELRPKAPEGYVALSYFLKQRAVADAVQVYLEGLVKAGADFPVLRLALAHRYSGRPEALAHFEAVVKQVGEDPELLETMIYSAVFPNYQAGRRHYFRIFKAELDRSNPSFAYIRWEGARPTAEEQRELATLYETALAKDGGYPWMRRRLIDLYSALKESKAARRHADAVVGLVEVQEEPQIWGAADRALEFYILEKDWDSALRLQQAFAVKAGVAARKIAGLFETEIAAARASMADLRKLVDDRIRPEWNPREKLSYSPTYVRLIQVLQREKRSTEFIGMIVEAIGDGDNRAMYIDIVEAAIRDFRVPHADGQTLTVRLREKTSGTLAGPADLVAVARQYQAAKQWGPAAEKATRVLAHPEASAVQKASAEGVLAECHAASGAFDQAVAACDRALELKDATTSTFRSDLQEIRARALLKAGRGRAAAEGYGRAFAELLSEKQLDRRWRAIQNLRRDVPYANEFRKDVEEAAAAKPEDGGLKVLLALVLERVGDYVRAAKALADVSSGDAYLLRDLGTLWARAGETRKAFDVRAAFMVLRETQREALRAVQAEDVRIMDGALVSVLAAQGDLAALKEFGVRLAKGPDSDRHHATLIRILVTVVDDAYIEQIHELVMGTATREDQRVYFRYPAAQAWHDLGKTDKAVALYKDAAEGKGVSAVYVRSAKELIERWEAEERDRVEFRRWVVARLEKLPPERSEPEELRAIISEVTTSRNLQLLDRQWQTALRTPSPDPFFLKLAAVRARGTDERRAILLRLTAVAEVGPGWRLELATEYLNSGEFAKAYDEVRELLKKRVLPAKERDLVLARCVPFARRLPAEKRAEFARELDAAGSFRWAWELREDFLADRATRLDFSRRWKAVAAPGEDRTRALEAVARTLLDLNRGKDALGELNEALEQKDLTVHRRRMLEELRLEPMVRFGPTAEAVSALIRHLELNPDSPHEAARWAYTVVHDRDGEEWLKFWDLSKPALPAAILFGSIVENRLHRPAAALARLQDGVRLFPGNPWLQRQLGDTASSLRKDDVAAEAYGKAVSLGKFSSWEAVYVRQQWIRATGRAGKPKEAADLIRATSDRAQRVQYAGIAVELRLYDLAVELYREDLEGRTETAALRLTLARVLKAAGKPEEAEAEYRLVLKSEGGERRFALSGLLDTLSEKKDAAGIAAVLLEEAGQWKDEGRNRQAFESLLWMIPHTLTRSVADEWLTLARRTPEVEAVRILTATLNYRWELRSVAFDEDLRTALERFPRSPGLHLMAAETWRESQLSVEAAGEYEKAAGLDPQGVQTGFPARVLRARALSVLMNGQEDLKAFPIAVAQLGEWGPQDGESRFARNALAGIESRLQDEFWPELIRHRLLLPLSKEGEAEVRRLVEELEADEIEKREAAEKGLRAAGVPALLPLARLLETSDLELGVRVRRTIRSILQQ